MKSRQGGGMLPVARRGPGSGGVDAVPTRGEGFYWVVLGQNPPEVAYWERGEWWARWETPSLGSPRLLP